MKNYFLLIIFVLANINLWSQTNETEEKIYFIADEMPIFPGGDKAFSKFIANNLKYPTSAMERGISGKVYIRFIVTTTGDVKKITVARGVDPLLDTEAVRVVSRSPKWTPGKENGVPVNVSYLIQVNFE